MTVPDMPEDDNVVESTLLLEYAYERSGMSRSRWTLCRTMKDEHPKRHGLSAMRSSLGPGTTRSAAARPLAEHDARATWGSPWQEQP